MTSPASYNLGAVEKHWNLSDIPVEWQGYTILLRGDLDRDLALDEDELASSTGSRSLKPSRTFNCKQGLTLRMPSSARTP